MKRYLVGICALTLTGVLAGLPSLGAGWNAPGSQPSLRVQEGREKPPKPPKPSALHAGQPLLASAWSGASCEAPKV